MRSQSQLRNDKYIMMKYHILYYFRTSAPFKEKSSDQFKDLHKMELLTYKFWCQSDVISGKSYELKV